MRSRSMLWKESMIVDSIAYRRLTHTMPTSALLHCWFHGRYTAS